MTTYQGHHTDGSSIQKHSAGGAYPFVLVLRDSKQPGSKFDWGVIGPGIDGIKWVATSEAWDRYVTARKWLMLQPRLCPPAYEVHNPSFADMTLEQQIDVGINDWRADGFSDHPYFGRTKADAEEVRALYEPFGQHGAVVG